MSLRTVALATTFWCSIMIAGPSAAQPPDPGDTRDFILSAVQSDTYEVDAAEVALAETRSDAVRSFAREMVEDHEKTSATLHQAAEASGIKPAPPSLSADGHQFLVALQSQGASDFDKAYLRQQIVAHKQALAVEQAYAASGNDRNVKKAARAAVPMIQRHLETAQRLQSSIGGS